MDLEINATTATNFLQDQTSTNDTLNIALEFRAFFTALTIKNHLTFEDNLGYKGDLPKVAYTDFETTAPTDNCFDPEQKSMFIVSHVIIVAFHPKLKMARVIIQCSFGYSLEKLTTIDYLTNDQMCFVDVHLIKQFKDSALNVHRKKCKNVIA